MKGLVALVLLVPAAAGAWGERVHVHLARHGLDALPETSCARRWLATVDDAALADAAVAPDLWRNPRHPEHRPGEGANHYLDVDAADPPESYPRSWPGAVGRFGPERARTLGRVPWHVERVLRELEATLRRKDTAALVRVYGHLSHDVTDAFSPLHATVDFNPRLSPEDKEGLHGRYESRLWEDDARMRRTAAETRRLLRRKRAPSEADQRPALSPGLRPRDALFEALLSGLPLARRLTEVDRSSGGELHALYGASSRETAERWEGATRLLSRWVEETWRRVGDAAPCPP